MMNVSEAESLLGVGGDYSKVALKSAYRAAAAEHHPDKGGDAEVFKQVSAAYKMLKGYATLCEGDADLREEYTWCGTPLKSLGHGYPITEAAKCCDNCEGKGYRQLEVEEYDGVMDCPVCYGTQHLYYKNLVCRKCEGDGKFKINGKVKGKCYKCEGTGVFKLKLKYPRACTNCFLGTVARKRKVKRYVKCDECKGVGEIKMWNPVIPRGLLR